MGRGFEEIESGDGLAQALRRFAMERDRFEGTIAHSQRISLTDLQALDHLSLHDGLTPGQLGERMLLTSGAVTALADRLEQHGWITREAHPTDRRSTVLRLTPRAVEAGVEIFAPFVADLIAVGEQLSASERAACAAFLERAADVAAAHAVQQAGGEAGG